MSLQPTVLWGNLRNPTPLKQVGCPWDPGSFLTKVLLQEGQHGPYHGLLGLVGIQAPTGMTG